jgi:predicted Mrr-cat superfamily restriction endonuclease
MATLTIRLRQPTANPFAFWLEEYIQSIRVKYFTRHTMFNDKQIQLILGAVPTLWCMLLQMTTTLIMSDTGMRGSLEYIMQRSSVLILMLWAEMRFAEWNSYG